MRESGPRVLVFGLDQRLAPFIVEVLAEDGYEVIVADSRPAALRLARTERPDVILVDLALSVCSCGWNLVVELRSSPDTSRIPLLIISDTQQCLAEAKAYIAGCHVILKPYDVDDLENGIAAAVMGRPVPPMPFRRPTTSDLCARAADAIARESYLITVQWLRRAQRNAGLAELEKIPIRLLINVAATWQIGVVSALRYGPEDASGRERIRDRIRGQIREARRHEVPRDQMIALFEIFHDAVWLTVDIAAFVGSPIDVSQLHRTLSSAFEWVIAPIAELYAPTSTAWIR